MSTVVVLLSDKRSGSTMLQDELCRHAAIQRVAHSPHTYFETHHWLKSALVLQRPDRLYSDGRAYEGYGSRANARAYLVDTLRGNLPDYTPPDDDEALVFGGWEALCRRHAQPVFFEKSPQLLAHWGAISLFLEWTRRTDLEVKVIGLVRNPLAVQYSAQALFASDACQRQLGWLEIQRNLLTVRAMLPAKSFKLVRYEDILTHHGVCFSQLCEFIGVPYDPGLGQAVHDGPKDRWRADASFTLRLDRSVVQMAKHFGYTDEDLVNPNATFVAPPAASVGFRRRLRMRLTHVRDRVVRPLCIRLKANLGTRG